MIKRISTIAFCLSVAATQVLGGERPADTTKQAETLPPAWTIKGNSSLTLTQVSLSNWVAGGENSYTLNSGIDVSARYKKGSNAWDNNLKMGYGFAWQKSIDRKINNADLIDFSSKYGRNASSSWYYSLLLGFKTQFARGYKTINDTIKSSDFLSPAYLSLSAGMDYKRNGLSALISPISGRMTVVNSGFLNSQGAFGVEPGKTTRMELGGLAKIMYETAFWENKILLKSSVELFSNYINKPQNIDINWSFDLNFKLSNYITFQIQLQAIYDDDVKIPIKDSNGNVIKNVAKLQMREFMGFGLAYSFDSTPKKP